MNFDDTPQEAAFRAEAKAWIGANAPKQYEDELRKASLVRVALKGANILEVAKAWQKKKADAGWACLHWPKEYGGRGASPIERVIWQQEEGVYGKLTQPFQIGEGMCGPTVMAWGSEEHKRRYLPKLASGEEIWCQLFSEPAGGSDVAGLRTRAEKQGDNWVINGTKCWITNGGKSTWYTVMAVTDPEKGANGISAFMVHKDDPGFTVGPLEKKLGIKGSPTAELYFENCRIPGDRIIGAACLAVAACYAGGYAAAALRLKA